MSYLENHNIVLTICSYLSMIMSAVLFGSTFLGGFRFTSNEEESESVKLTVQMVFVIMFLGSIQGVL